MLTAACREHPRPRRPATPEVQEIESRIHDRTVAVALPHVAAPVLPSPSSAFRRATVPRPNRRRADRTVERTVTVVHRSRRWRRTSAGGRASTGPSRAPRSLPARTSSYCRAHVQPWQLFLARRVGDRRSQGQSPSALAGARRPRRHCQAVALHHLGATVPDLEPREGRRLEHVLGTKPAPVRVTENGLHPERRPTRQAFRCPRMPPATRPGLGRRERAPLPRRAPVGASVVSSLERMTTRRSWPTSVTCQWSVIASTSKPRSA